MESIAGDLATMKRTPLEPEHVAALRNAGCERTYPAGAMVAEAGSPMDRFIYIEDGEIELVDPFTGKRYVPTTLGPTQFAASRLPSGGNFTLPMRA